MSTKKAAASAGGRRFAQAVDAFEKAVKAFGKKEFDKARDQFRAVLDAYPDERDLRDRARVYIAICDRATHSRAAYRPKTAPEMLAYGVFLHNRAEFQEAVKHLRQAAQLEPKNDHVQYCLAASLARAGEAEGAIRALRSAIELSPESRAQARADSDFDPLRDEDAFADLVIGE